MIDTLIEIAGKASAVVLEIAERGYATHNKNDDSPVTEADLASNKLICEHLTKHFPHIPILSEETKQADFETRKNWPELFIIDPIDGTKEFIKGNGEYTINIGYVKNGKAVTGVCAVPSKNTIYYASQGLGAFKLESGKESVKLPQESTKPMPQRVLVSRSHFDGLAEELYSDYLLDKDKVEFIPCGSSYKVCKLAEGSAEFYPRFIPTKEWDIAAVQIILEEAGGHIVDAEKKEPLVYNKENIRNPFFIAVSKDFKEYLNANQKN
jgi:3'(2'), 5'-bisphosphate nucleotidase